MFKLPINKFFKQYFTTQNVVKVLIIFSIGISSRYFVNTYFQIDIFKEYTSIISMVYYLIFSTFVVFINEWFSNFHFQGNGNIITLFQSCKKNIENFSITIARNVFSKNLLLNHIKKENKSIQDLLLNDLEKNSKRIEETLLTESQKKYDSSWQETFGVKGKDSDRYKNTYINSIKNRGIYISDTRLSVSNISEEDYLNSMKRIISKTVNPQDIEKEGKPIINKYLTYPQYNHISLNDNIKNLSPIENSETRDNLEWEKYIDKEKLGDEKSSQFDEEKLKYFYQISKGLKDKKYTKDN